MLNLPDYSRRDALAWLAGLVNSLVFGSAMHVKPPPKRYLLNRFSIAGLAYYEGRHNVRQGRVCIGDELRLVAEPSDPHDKFAVEIFHAALRVKLGYVPCSDNNHINHLLRQGALLHARVLKADPEAESRQAVRAAVELLVK